MEHAQRRRRARAVATGVSPWCECAIGQPRRGERATTIAMAPSVAPSGLAWKRVLIPWAYAAGLQLCRASGAGRPGPCPSVLLPTSWRPQKQGCTRHLGGYAGRLPSKSLDTNFRGPALSVFVFGERRIATANRPFIPPPIQFAAKQMTCPTGWRILTLEETSMQSPTVTPIPLTVRRRLAALVLACATLLVASAALAGSPRDGLVVTAPWLAQHLHDPDLVLLHVGAKAGYEAGAIGRAGVASVSDRSIAAHTGKGLMLEMPPAEDLRHRLEALGISDKSRVVVYYGKDWVSPT